MTMQMQTGGGRAERMGMARNAARTMTGGKYEPVSVGTHAFRFVDVVDLGMSVAPGATEAKPQIMFVLMTDEVGEDGQHKLLSAYCKPSLYGGKSPGRSDSFTSSLMKMLRGVTGIPDLSQSRLIEMGFDVSRLPVPLDKDGNELPGVIGKVDVEHRQTQDGRVRAAPIWDSFAKLENGEAHLAPSAEAWMAYERPAWVARRSIDAQGGRDPGLAPALPAQAAPQAPQAAAQAPQQAAPQAAAQAPAAAPQAAPQAPQQARVVEISEDDIPF